MSESRPDLNQFWFYLLIVNVAGLLLMGFDKVSAKLGSKRVPEMCFFLISLAGGFGGIMLGMITFHHKTNKPNFQLKMVGAAVLATSTILFLVMRQ